MKFHEMKMLAIDFCKLIHATQISLIFVEKKKMTKLIEIYMKINFHVYAYRNMFD